MKKRQIELTIEVFHSFEEAEKSQREYWWSLTPLERLKQQNLSERSTMDEMILPEDFRDFLKLLNKHQVEYLLIGGYAVFYHGYPRATEDIDFWVAINPDNAQRLVHVMRDFGLSLQPLICFCGNIKLLVSDSSPTELRFSPQFLALSLQPVT